MRSTHQLSRFGISTVIAMHLMACNTPSYNEEDLKHLLPAGQSHLSSCMMNSLGYESDVDMVTYHPLAIDYFTEIKDFPTGHQRELEKLLLLSYDHREDISVVMDTISDTLRIAQLGREIDSLSHSIDSLSSYLGGIKKNTVGYVFLHTFVTMEDTMGFIFVMDTACNNTEIVRVKLPAPPPDPEEYKRLIESDSL